MRKTMTQKPIDIIQEFVDLYKHEQMLAFFEFHVGDVAGLCRISKPKSEAPGTRYLSLTFMADAPDERTRAAVDEVLDRINDEAFQNALPPVAAVVPVPNMITGAENYVRQVDLMLKAYVAPGQPFIAERLIPVLVKLTGIDVGAVEWWEGTTAASGKGAVHSPPATKSFLAGLTARFKK
jgi:hypothetical protein